MTTARRAFFVPEVVQTSAMDCGPAALQSLFAGFGEQVSYGRLREACQTGVDGTSIDVLEEVAGLLGLDCAQVLVPLDHMGRVESASVPCIAVVQLPDGVTHFVVVWRKVGRWLQLMDPAVGRRWVRADDLRASLYAHTMQVPAAAWREWAGSASAQATYRARLADIGSDRSLLARANADQSWRSLAAFDAGLRFVTRMVVAGALSRGEARGALTRLLADPTRIPESAWSARAHEGEGDDETLRVTGAVSIAASGPKKHAERAARETLPLELRHALDEPKPRPWLALMRELGASGWLGPILAFVTVLAVALGATLESLLFRGLVDADRLYTTPEQSWLGWGAALVLVVVVGALELGGARLVRRVGRALETRLRLAFAHKVPRLGDRYFQSRPISDMAERGHMLHVVRALPALVQQLVRAAAGLVAVTAGILWLDPEAWPIVVPGVVLALLVPLLAHPALAERDLRRRTHGGSLFRLTLDALLGLVAVRTHTAEGAIRREHEGLLADWLRAGQRAQRVAVLVEVLQAAVGAGIALALVLGYLARVGSTGTVLLLTWWALEIPLFAQALAQAARQYPLMRNTLLRVLEPLGAPTQEPVITNAHSQTAVAVALQGVTVAAGGHTILDDVSLTVGAGEHVAVVGPSGAGKSSLVGLLLGWHQPVAGAVVVDGTPLDASGLAALRRRTAWVDPEVQLWNQSLVDNVTYGSDARDPDRLARAIDDAELRGVIEDLPDGLQTSLGEGGGFLSGGQGQRVRLARGLFRRADLVILDEALRGLDRDQRRRILARMRERWRDATLICITHDMVEAATFDRVVVIEGGRVAEDGDPRTLSTNDGAFARMVAAEHTTRDELWRSTAWRHLRVADGRVDEVRA